MTGKKILIICSLGLQVSFVCKAQYGGVDIKHNEIMAQQKDFANQVASKTTLLPIQLPDAKSLISMNQSGDGNITLPLVNVKGRKLNLPISISYNTNGIKIDQHASEVGLGWNITIGSIVRDYGAYEPDYTYTGSEFDMLSHNGNSMNDDKITANSFYTNSTFSAYVQSTDHIYSPINQNKFLEYDNATGKAPDTYELNVAGLKSNDFWNSDATVPTYDSAPNAPSFVFSDNVPWLVTFTKKTDTFSQEISRINEFNYQTNPVTGTFENYQGPSTSGQSYNMAAAIAFYPYVINQETVGLVSTMTSALSSNQFDELMPTIPTVISSPNTQIKYEDYASFTITTDDGTQYIFGKALRGQKYLFTEEPYWSTMETATYLSQGGSPEAGKVYGEFWKTDYIAEWLLTEVHSNDYVDANNDGVADDGDNGDWIKIDYGDSIQYENPPGINAALPVPKHREWLNFSQTDRPSSLMRERAYVKKITTPVEVVTFSTSERFDVDLDYFNSSFNRINDSYVYNNQILLDPSAGQTEGGNNANDPIDPTYPQTNKLDINYPSELLRYDTVKVNDNISSTEPLVQNMTLNYAEKGSTQELAVSNYLIMDNNKNFVPYDPSALGYSGLYGNGYSIDSLSYLQTVGRGKTTLLGIDYRGNNTTSTDKISYSFNYGFNPSYNSIHIFQIQKMGAAADIRESLRSPNVRWPGVRTDVVNNNSVIPNSILPWETMEVDEYGNSKNPGENWGFPVREDELGYYYDPTKSLNGRNAWSLSSINLPYGGTVNINYDLDQIDITNDRINWIANDGLADYCLPSVGHYNNVAYLRDIAQAHINNYFLPYALPDDLLHLYNQYYFMLNSNSGGLRISNITMKDNFGAPDVTKQYSYGTGHYTSPPADYWSNYLDGFSSFIYNERIEHGRNQLFDLNVQTVDYSDYNNTMVRLVTDVRTDNSVKQQAQHYYEYIDEVNGDGSKTRTYYGQLYNNMNNANPQLVYNKLESGIIKAGGVSGNFNRNNVSELLTMDIDNSKKIGAYKTEYYDNNGLLVKKQQTDYSFIEEYNNMINLGCNTLHVNYAGRMTETSQPTGCGITLPSYEYDFYTPDPALSDDQPNIVQPYLPPNYITVQLMPSQENGTEVYSYGNNAFCYWGTPVGTGKDLFDDLSPNVLAFMGYNNVPSSFNNTSGTTTINSVAEAVNPLIKIAINSGMTLSGNVPDWFQPLANIPAPWGQSTTNATTVKNDLTTMININTNHHNVDPYGSRFPIFWYTDSRYFSNAFTYKSHQSYRLQPSHIQTISSFN